MANQTNGSQPSSFRVADERWREAARRICADILLATGAQVRIGDHANINYPADGGALIELMLYLPPEVLEDAC